MMLKSQNNNDASDSILVSFDAKWAEPLAEGSVSQVFRKRGPKSTSPNWVYVYAGTPIKAVIGRLPVMCLRQLALKESLALADEGALKKRELQEYAGEYSSLFVFTVEKFQPASSPAPYSKLKEDYGFAPPQSFLILSEEGKIALDALCGFAEGVNNV
jgi:predicted transcriptional regulator